MKTAKTEAFENAVFLISYQRAKTSPTKTHKQNALGRTRPLRRTKSELCVS